MKRIRVIDKAQRKSRRQLTKQKQLTASEINRAMQAAGDAIDELNGRNTALERIVALERAQNIYWMQTAEALHAGKIHPLKLAAWNDLPESDQARYVKQAIVELSAKEEPKATLQ